MIIVTWKDETICVPDEPVARDDFTLGGTVYAATGYVQESSDQRRTRKLLWHGNLVSSNPPANWDNPDKVFDLDVDQEI